MTAERGAEQSLDNILQLKSSTMHLLCEITCLAHSVTGCERVYSYFATEVARAQYVMYLPRLQQLPKLGRYV